MLQIVLMIIKIIGIIILVLLGALLGVLVTVLFVPIRYRLFAEWKNELYLKGTVSWLLHLIHTRITIERTKPHIIIRILGFAIYDSEKPRKPRKEKNAIKKKAGVSKTKIAKESISTKVTKYDKETIINYKSNDTEISDHETEITKNIIETENKYNNIETDNKINTIETADNINDNDDKFNHIDYEDNIDDREQTKENFFEKIVSKIRYIYRRIKAIFINFINRIKRLLQSFLDLRRKGSLIIEFLQDEMNKEGFRFTFSRIRKLLKHILPTKLKASLNYGTGDPCSTGQILGVLGILYSFYGDKVQVTPDFENRTLEGWLDARGRIRLITILIIVIKLILDRRFKQLKNNWITLKEAL